MAVVTTQVINRYFNDYQNTEVTFSKEIMHTLKMDPRQIYVKSGGLQWPCIVNSTSFNQAKIILSVKSGAYEVFSKKLEVPASLRFSFFQPDGQTLNFFIAGKVANISPYMNSAELVIVTLQYTQRPPDDLILMIGSLLDANINSVKRKEERIPITQESMRKLGLAKKEIVAVVQNVPRHCLLQDLSFGGAKIVLLGLAQFLVNKEIVIQLEFDEPHETIIMKGVIVGANLIEGRKDILVASVAFKDESISLPYKIHVNKYIANMRKSELESAAPESESNGETAAETPASAPADSDGTAKAETPQADSAQTEPPTA